MSASAQQIIELRRRVEAAELQQARAEALHEAAQRAAETARSRLVEEFGVSTLAEAQELLRQMERQISEQMRQISATLDENGL